MSLRASSKSRKAQQWSTDEEKQLKKALKKFGYDYDAIAAAIGKTKSQVKDYLRSQSRSEPAEEPLIALFSPLPGEKGKGVKKRLKLTMTDPAAAVKEETQEISEGVPEVLSEHEGELSQRQQQREQEEDEEDEHEKTSVASTPPKRPSAAVARAWVEEEIEKFEEGIKLFGRNWDLIAQHIGTRTAYAVRGRYGWLEKKHWRPDGTVVDGVVVSPIRTRQSASSSSASESAAGAVTGPGSTEAQEAQAVATTMDGRNKPWTSKELKLFQEGVEKFEKDFVAIANHIGTRSEKAVHGRYYFFLKEQKRIEEMARREQAKQQQQKKKKESKASTKANMKDLQTPSQSSQSQSASSQEVNVDDAMLVDDSAVADATTFSLPSRRTKRHREETSHTQTQHAHTPIQSPAKTKATKRHKGTPVNSQSEPADESGPVTDKIDGFSIEERTEPDRPWTEEEDIKLKNGVKRYGKVWKKVASLFNGRTASEVESYYELMKSTEAVAAASAHKSARKSKDSTNHNNNNNTHHHEKKTKLKKKKSVTTPTSRKLVREDSIADHVKARGDLTTEPVDSHSHSHSHTTPSSVKKKDRKDKKERKEKREKKKKRKSKEKDRGKIIRVDSEEDGEEEEEEETKDEVHVEKKRNIPWTIGERKRYRQAYDLYPRNWAKMALHVGTRSPAEIELYYYKIATATAAVTVPAAAAEQENEPPTKKRKQDTSSSSSSIQVESHTPVHAVPVSSEREGETSSSADRESIQRSNQLRAEADWMFVARLLREREETVSRMETEIKEQQEELEARAGRMEHLEQDLIERSEKLRETEEQMAEKESALEKEKAEVEDYRQQALVFDDRQQSLDQREEDIVQRESALQTREQDIESRYEELRKQEHEAEQKLIRDTNQLQQREQEVQRREEKLKQDESTFAQSQAVIQLKEQLLTILSGPSSSSTNSNGLHTNCNGKPQKTVPRVDAVNGVERTIILSESDHESDSADTDPENE